MLIGFVRWRVLGIQVGSSETVFSGRRQGNGIEFSHFDANRVRRRKRLNVIHGFSDLPLPCLGIAGTRNRQQNDLIDFGLMELKIGDSLAAVHQVCEIFSVDDTAARQKKIVAGAANLKVHQREVVAARANLRGEIAAIFIAIADERHRPVLNDRHS